MFLSKSRVKDVIEMVVKDRQLLMVGKICKITVKAGQPQDLQDRAIRLLSEATIGWAVGGL